MPSKILLKSVKTIIIGHEHPAINLTSGARVEKYKCFLLGKFEKKNLIVMPSCNLLIEGTDVLSGNFLSPYLINSNIETFEVFVTLNEIYSFGKIKTLRSKMRK